MAIKYQNEVPQHICISVILIDSVFRIDENYCPQVFLEECKYVVKKKKEKKYAWIWFWQEDSDTGNSDEEDSNEQNSNEENFDTTV